MFVFILSSSFVFESGFSLIFKWEPLPTRLSTRTVLRFMNVDQYPALTELSGANGAFHTGFDSIIPPCRRTCQKHNHIYIQKHFTSINLIHCFEMLVFIKQHFVVILFMILFSRSSYREFRKQVASCTIYPQ